MLFVEHDQMIGTLAPDRPDQAFNMAVPSSMPCEWIFPQSLILAARRQGNDVVSEVGAKSAIARKIHDSYMSFRDRTAAWSRISIKAVLEAREG